VTRLQASQPTSRSSIVDREN